MVCFGLTVFFSGRVLPGVWGLGFAPPFAGGGAAAAAGAAPLAQAARQALLPLRVVPAVFLALERRR